MRTDTFHFHNWSLSEAPPPATLVPSVSVPCKPGEGLNRDHALGSGQIAPSRPGLCRPTWEGHEPKGHFSDYIKDILRACPWTPVTSSAPLRTAQSNQTLRPPVIAGLGQRSDKLHSAPVAPSPLHQAWIGNSPSSSESDSSEEPGTLDQTESTQMDLPTARKIAQQIEKELAKEMEMAKKMEMTQQTEMDKHKKALSQQIQTDGQNQDGIRVQGKTLARPSKRKRTARERVPTEFSNEDDTQIREISLLEYIQATVPKVCLGLSFRVFDD